GAENDARVFRDWVASPAGGAVPADHVHLIVSSQFEPSRSPQVARPNVSDIEEPFARLHEIAVRNASEANGLRVGRRLYIYLAGHAFTPSINNAALLLANATRQRVADHVPGQLWADWVLRAGYFSEVVLFMDCSRQLVPVAPLRVPPFSLHEAPKAVG